MDETLNPNSESPANLLPPSGVWLTPDELDEWATALESGKYRQGAGTLKHEGKYCCLGVLGEMKGVLSSVGQNYLYAIDHTAGTHEYHFLPGLCQLRAGTWNDRKAPFANIASNIRLWAGRLRSGETWAAIEADYPRSAP